MNERPKIDRIQGKMGRVLLVLAIGVILTSVNTGRAQDAAEDFRQNCMSCHTIGGGRLSGPDLKNVTFRKDYDWLVRFILNPRAVIDAGDRYAADLVQESRGAIMPTLPGLTRGRAEKLLDLIITESKLEKSQFIGIQISDRPFSAEDVETGRRIFLGYQRLKNEGASCISCHAVHGVKGLGGGTLGPDLTTVFERYEGRRALATWLSAPATPTMQAMYKKKLIEPDEVLSLVAYFQNTLQRNPEDTSTSRLNFVLLGLGGALVVLGFFDVVWKRRLRSVRRFLVHPNVAENDHV